MKKLILFSFLIASFSQAFSDKASRNRRHDLDEAIQLALESSPYLLLPPTILVAKIASDLRLIRQIDPRLKKHVHTPKWVPGEVLVRQRDISEEQIDVLQSSEFAPVTISEKGVAAEKGNGAWILKFGKPYNPELLPSLLKTRFGFISKPHYVYVSRGGNNKKGDVILYRHDLSTYFWNSKNGKNCVKGCFTQFSVSFGNTRKYNYDEADNYINSDAN